MAPDDPPGRGAATPAPARPRSTYRELPPPAMLAGLVACVWTQAVGEGVAPYEQRVLPDGCVDVIWMGETVLSLAGPATGPELVPIASGTTLVGVRFHPGTAPSMLGLPARELLNGQALLADAWGRPAEHLAERLAEAPSAAARLAILPEALAARLPHARPPDPLVAAAVTWLRRQPGTRVRDLGVRIGLSDRQLLRRFDAAVGYGPKTLARVLRLQRFLALAERPAGPRAPGPAVDPSSAGGFGAAGPEDGLAALAVAAGYADQAHLSHDCAELAGLPPAGLLAARSA